MWATGNIQWCYSFGNIFDISIIFYLKYKNKKLYINIINNFHFMHFNRTTKLPWSDTWQQLKRTLLSVFCSGTLPSYSRPVLIPRYIEPLMSLDAWLLVMLMLKLSYCRGCSLPGIPSYVSLLLQMVVNAPWCGWVNAGLSGRHRQRYSLHSLSCTQRRFEGASRWGF